LYLAVDQSASLILGTGVVAGAAGDGHVTLLSLPTLVADTLVREQVTEVFASRVQRTSVATFARFDC